jgi:hypothetical protein
MEPLNTETLNQDMVSQLSQETVGEVIGKECSGNVIVTQMKNLLLLKRIVKKAVEMKILSSWMEASIWEQTDADVLSDCIRLAAKITLYKKESKSKKRFGIRKSRHDVTGGNFSSKEICFIRENIGNITIKHLAKITGASTESTWCCATGNTYSDRNPTYPPYNSFMREETELEKRIRSKLFFLY